MHAFLTGMIYKKQRSTLPELAGKFLGQVMKHFVNIFSILLLLLMVQFCKVQPLLLHNLMDGRIALGINHICYFCILYTFYNSYQ